MTWQTQNTAGHDTHGQTAIYDEANGKDIAIVYDGDSHARLISAAPELLEVAKLIRGFFEYGGQNIKLIYGETAQAILDKTRATIAKAEGKD